MVNAVVATKYCKDNRSVLLLRQEDIPVQARFPGHKINADGVQDICQGIYIYPYLKYARKGLIMAVVGGKNGEYYNCIDEKNDKPHAYNKKCIPADGPVIIDHLVIDGIDAEQYQDERIGNEEHRIEIVDTGKDKILRYPTQNGKPQQYQDHLLIVPETLPVVELHQQQQAFE